MLIHVPVVLPELTMKTRTLKAAPYAQLAPIALLLEISHDQPVYPVATIPTPQQDRIHALHAHWELPVVLGPLIALFVLLVNMVSRVLARIVEQDRSHQHQVQLIVNHAPLALSLALTLPHLAHHVLQEPLAKEKRLLAPNAMLENMQIKQDSVIV